MRYSSQKKNSFLYPNIGHACLCMQVYVHVYVYLARAKYNIQALGTIPWLRHPVQLPTSFPTNGLIGEHMTTGSTLNQI